MSTSTQTRPRGRPASGTSFVRVRGHRGGPSRGPSPLAAVGAEGLSSEPPTLAHAFLTVQGQKLGLPGRPGDAAGPGSGRRLRLAAGFCRGRWERSYCALAHGGRDVGSGGGRGRRRVRS